MLNKILGITILINMQELKKKQRRQKEMCTKESKKRREGKGKRPLNIQGKQSSNFIAMGVSIPHPLA